MIVVTVGTNETRFDRLLEWVAALDSREPLVVQHGPSTVRPPAARCVAYLPFEELAELVAASRAVVTHAGVGSIMMALSVERRPIVVPRLRLHGEAVDDHQVALARRLDAEGLVVTAETPTGLAAAVRQAPGPASELGRPTKLAHDIRAYLRDEASLSP